MAEYLEGDGVWSDGVGHGVWFPCEGFSVRLSGWSHEGSKRDRRVRRIQGGTLE
jgi:hypothetical protein